MQVHLHNLKALRLAPRHKPLTTLADIFRVSAKNNPIYFVRYKYIHQSDCLTHFVHTSAALAKGCSIPPERCDAHIISHIFNVWCLMLYIHMFYLLGMYSTRCSLVGAKNFNRNHVRLLTFARSYHFIGQKCSIRIQSK